MVGIVLVSHSAKLAEGVAELAHEMGGPEVALEAAGGLTGPEVQLGTDAALVLEAVERAYGDDGVLVLMDLGSAVLSAEMALDLLPPEQRERVLLCEAPLVEGAVAAAVAAKLGASLEEVAAEARGGLQGKAAHLGAEVPAPAPAEEPGSDEGRLRLHITLRNRLGLHARPAARFVRTAARFDAEIDVTNLATGRGPASARSLNALATLGARRGHELLVAARGPEAEGALAALEALAKRGFGEAVAEAPAPSLPVPARGRRPSRGTSLVGLPASPGIALGPARHFRLAALEIPTEPAADAALEWEGLQTALEQTRRELEDARAGVAARAGEYDAAIFDAHLLYLDDEALLAPARRAVFEEGRNAAEAWSAAAEETAEEYRRLEDEYQRARADDVSSVARQVLAHLLGVGSARPSLEALGIVVVPDLSPADAAALDPAVVRGIATAYGGPTSHGAILARALGLPAVVGAGAELLEIAEGANLALDGDAGVVEVEPRRSLVDQYTARQKAQQAVRRAAREAAHGPAVTRDGQRVEIMANVGSLDEAEAAVAAGAEGVGLLRTEFLFLEREDLPSEEEQADAYRRIAEVLAGKPLTLRTLDVGADKPLPYLPRPVEANPFLGVRGIRLGLERRELMRTQLRAAVRVAAEYPLRIMFPMVATVEELRAGRSLLARAEKEIGGRVEVGIMVEVPAAALTAGMLAPHVDFFSIGTNDLAQYTMAAERGNEQVAALGDGLHPAVLGLIAGVVEAASARGKWVGICGELAADPIAVPLLVGLGVSELSVTPPAISAVKQAVRGVDTTAAQALARGALALEGAADVRALVADSSRPS